MNGNVLFYFILVCIYCTTWNNFQANKENTIPTENKKIMIAKVRHYEYTDILDTYGEFENLSRTVKIMDTVKLMKKVVPEFKSKNSPKFEVLDNN